MKNYITAIVTASVFVIALFLAAQLLLPLLTPKNGYLQISSSIPTKIALADKQLGESPYRGDNLKVGTYKLELEGKFATASSKKIGGRLVKWSGSISLYSNSLSVVNLDFGPSEPFYASEILTLRKGTTSISVATQPSSVKVELDGNSVGETPLVKEIKAGAHRLRLSKENYLERQIDINVQDGFQTIIQVSLAVNPLPKTTGKLATKDNANLYNLATDQAALLEKTSGWADAVWFFQEKGSTLETKFDALIDSAGKSYFYDETAFKDKIKIKAAVNLAYLSKTSEKTLSSAASATWETLFPVVKTNQVQILTTPTGKLNVRENPNQSSKILTTVKPGEKYDVLSEQAGWYKIKAGTILGWVSADYAKKL